MVYIADNSHTTFVQGLLALVCMINAKALDLTMVPKNLIDAALSTYKLSGEQVIDISLDIITGCHVYFLLINFFNSLKKKNITILFFQMFLFLFFILNFKEKMLYI